MAKKTPDNRKLFPRDVLVQLDEREALELHDKAQRHDARADELEEALKEEAKERKAQIARLRSEAERDRSAASKREQLVSMQCYETVEGSQVYARRADTDEVIDQRPATADDQQQAFPGLDPGGELPLEPDYAASGAEVADEAVAPARKGRKRS